MKVASFSGRRMTLTIYRLLLRLRTLQLSYTESRYLMYLLFGCVASPFPLLFVGLLNRSDKAYMVYNNLFVSTTTTFISYHRRDMSGMQRLTVSNIRIRPDATPQCFLLGVTSPSRIS
ncbi:hypothetical protein F5Y05DRAFT_400308 [Hypoxylon sp. FL0543]|nr:hypothetical protein F5Y05DRAFT_400308 [Hypoxylon sp. FL0543]